MQRTRVEPSFNSGRTDPSAELGYTQIEPRLANSNYNVSAKQGWTIDSFLLHMRIALRSFNN